MNSLGKQQYKLTVYLTLGLSALCVLLRVLSVLFFYDKDMAYYTSGAILPIASTIIFLLCAVTLLCFCLFFIKNGECVSIPLGMSRYAALLPAGFFIYQCVLLLSSGVTEDYLALLTLIAAVLSAIFFVCLAFGYKSYTVFLGLGFIIWLALVWVASYTDFTLPMNSPDKIFFHFGCIGGAFLTVAELRNAAGCVKTRLHFCWLSLTVLLLSSSVLVSLICKLLGAYKSNTPRIEEFILLAVLVFGVIRLFTSEGNITADSGENEPKEENTQNQL